MNIKTRVELIGLNAETRRPTQRIDHVYVTFSRRNIRHMLEALDRGFGSGLVRRCEDGTILHAMVEEDAEHYVEREPGMRDEPLLTADIPLSVALKGENV